MQRRRSAPKRALLATLALTAMATPAAAQDLLWVRQFGTSSTDVFSAVDVDGAGNAHVSGATGDLTHRNALHAKYDPEGNLLWTTQFGSPENDFAHDVAVDGAGNVFFVGVTRGDLGGPNVGSRDGFLVKHNNAGRRLWARQIGTGGWDEASGVAVDDAGNAYVTGQANGNLGGPSAGGYDAFLAKYDAAGNLLWTRQIGTEMGDVAQDVAVTGAGSAYIAGNTSGSLGGPSAGGSDAFLVRYDPAGNLLWTRQFGTPDHEGAYGVAVDGAGNAYIAGYTEGSLGGTNAGDDDAFLAKYDAAGALLWTRQIGTPKVDIAWDVAVDAAGNAYITGVAGGALGGPFAGGPSDVFLFKYDPAGNLRWSRQAGTGTNDCAYGVAVDDAGNAYIGGATQGSFGGPSAGGRDAILARFGCFADCDQSTGAGVLDIFDFLCFQDNFISGEPYACDCDTSTGPGVCDIFDFLCFQGALLGGCS
jgi:Beta-propeller repeat